MAEVVETKRVESAEPPLVTTEVRPGRPGLSWSAIFGGAVAALGIWVLLYALGLAVGLSGINASRPASFRLPGRSAGILAVIVPIFALFVGGWVAGRSAGIVGRAGGAVHGLVVWSLTTLIGGALVVSALSAVVGEVATISQAVANAGGEAAAAGGGQPPGAGPVLTLDPTDALRPLNERLQAEGKAPIPATALQNATKQAAGAAIAQGRFDRNALAQAIMADTGLPQFDAETVADRLQDQFQQRTAEIRQRAEAAADEAREGALKAAQASGKAFWGLFGALIVGLASATLGGAAGASAFPRRLRRERVSPRAPLAPRREVYP